jgi:hypothetical protein
VQEALDLSVLTAVSRALWRALRVELYNRSGLPSAEPAAVTFVQRFGGSLNLNVHLHLVCTDGVFVLDKSGVRFVPLPEPTTEQIERVVERARTSILRWKLGERGLDRRSVGADRVHRVSIGIHDDDGEQWCVLGDRVFERRRLCRRGQPVRDVGADVDSVGIGCRTEPEPVGVRAGDQQRARRRNVERTS